MKYRFKAWGYKDKETGRLSSATDEFGVPELATTRKFAREFRGESEKVVRLDVTMDVKECGE